MDTRHDLNKKKLQITINTTRNHDESNKINVKIDINCYYDYWIYIILKFIESGGKIQFIEATRWKI